MCKRWVIDCTRHYILACNSRCNTDELRKFLARKKIEMDQKMADPGSLNLAAKSGTMSVETMKNLGISAGAFKQHVVSVMLCLLQVVLVL
jgi:hypothetical protein